jgi:hypothetical protein
MQYFRLTQDVDFVHAPRIPELFRQIDWRDAVPEKCHKIADVTLFSITAKTPLDFIDLLDKPLFLVSRPLKDLLRLYMPALEWRIVIITDRERQAQATYHLPIFAPLDCLSAKSLQTPDNSRIKHLILTPLPQLYPPLFRVRHNMETIIIARLDAAESILRRKLRGLGLQQVELE